MIPYKHNTKPLGFMLRNLSNSMCTLNPSGYGFEPDDFCVILLDMLDLRDPKIHLSRRGLESLQDAHRELKQPPGHVMPCRICWASPGHVMFLRRVMLVVFSGSSFFHVFFSEEITAITCEHILWTLGLWPQNHQPTKKSSVNTTILQFCVDFKFPSLVHLVLLPVSHTYMQECIHLRIPNLGLVV